MPPCPPDCETCYPPKRQPTWSQHEASLLQHAVQVLESAYLFRVRSEDLDWSQRANFEERLGELRRAHLRILELVA